MFEATNRPSSFTSKYQEVLADIEHQEARIAELLESLRMTKRDCAVLELQSMLESGGYSEFILSNVKQYLENAKAAPLDAPLDTLEEVDFTVTSSPVVATYPEASVVVPKQHVVRQAAGSAEATKLQKPQQPQVKTPGIHRGTAAKIANLEQRIVDAFSGLEFSRDDVIAGLNLRQEWGPEKGLDGYIKTRLSNSPLFGTAGRRDGKLIVKKAPTAVGSAAPVVATVPTVVATTEPTAGSETTTDTLGGYDPKTIEGLPFRSRIAFALGEGNTMSSKDIMDRFKSLGWVIKSEQPQRYIYMTVRSEEAMFSCISGQIALKMTLKEVLSDAEKRPPSSSIPEESNGVVMNPFTMV